MKKVEFIKRAGKVFEKGACLICDDDTAKNFSVVAKITEYEPEKKQKEVTTNGK